MKTGSERTVEMKYNTLNEAIEAGNYSFVYIRNLLDHTPIYQCEKIHCQFFNYYSNASHIDMEFDMALNLYRPATALEGLAFGAQYPEIQNKFEIICLGTKTTGEHQQVLALNSGTRGRQVGLQFYKSLISWQPRYLGVRINPDSPAPPIDTDKGDWLPLEEDLKFLKKRTSDSGFHIIDTDHYPFIPEGVFNPNTIIRHEKRGLLELRPNVISIIKPWGNSLTHAEFIGQLQKKKTHTANSNVLDYWLKYSELIPKECLLGKTFFYGTILENDNDTQFIRTLVAKSGEDLVSAEEPLRSIIHMDAKVVIFNI